MIKTVCSVVLKSLQEKTNCTCNDCGKNFSNEKDIKHYMIVTWNNCGKRLINEKDKTVWYFENYFAPAMNVE